MSDPMDREGRLAADDTLDDLETPHLIDLVRAANGREQAHVRAGRLELAQEARVEAGELARALRHRGVQPADLAPGAREARLRTSARVVDEVARTLDGSKSEPCGHCGLRKHANMAEYELVTELNAVVRKLRSLASRLALEERKAEST